MEGYIRLGGGGQMMYLFDDLGSDFQNLTLGSCGGGVSTVAIALVLNAQ